VDNLETQKGSKMNAKVAATINDGLRVEHVGDEIVLLDSAGLVAHTLSGDVARCFELVANGQTETEISPALETLAAAGLVTITDGTDETAMSRRKALAFGAVGAGVVAVGLSSMALPAAADTASSGSTTTSSSTTTTLPPGSPTNDAVIGVARNQVAPFRYSVLAIWENDTTLDPYDYNYVIKVSADSPVLTPGQVLYTNSTVVSGDFTRRVVEWETNETLIVTITLTSVIGGVVQTRDENRP